MNKSTLVNRAEGTAYRSRFYARYVDSRSKPGFKRPEEAPQGLREFLDNIVGLHFPGERKSRIIDLGCGQGLLVHAARCAGYEDIVGVDGSPQQVGLAGEMGIAGVTHGDVMDVLRAAANERFDTVVTLDVIEHMTKDEALALADEVHRTLRTGGNWIIHTVNAESPFFGQVRYGDFTHESAYTRESISQLLKIVGFSRVSCHEDRPIPRRISGIARLALWTVVRTAALIFLVAEGGTGARHALLSRNFLAVATK